MERYLRNYLNPLGTLLILSSCLVLVWFLYSTVYQPLFKVTAPTVSASDYTVQTATLNQILSQLDARTQSTIDTSVVPNPFTPTLSE